MDAYVYFEVMARIKAVIYDMLAEEAKVVQLQVLADGMRAAVIVDGVTAVVLNYFKLPHEAEDDSRLLKISLTTKVEAAKTTDPLLHVVGKILANARLLEAKICQGETGKLLDDIQVNWVW